MYKKENDGIVVSIDNIGRLVIPKYIREKIGIQNDKTVCMTLQQDRVIVKKNISEKETFVNSVYEVFIKVWQKYHPSDTFIITDLKQIIRVYGKNKEAFFDRKLDNNILAMINDKKFKYFTFNKTKICSSVKEKNFDIFSLDKHDKRLGTLIIVHENIRKNLKGDAFIYDLLKGICSIKKNEVYNEIS